MTRLTITLRDGQSHSFDVQQMPPHWKSWLMQQLPRSTDFAGCTFTKQPAAERSTR